MKKKVLSILLSAAMVAAMVSGCGSKDEGSSSADSADKTEASSDDAAASDATYEGTIKIGVVGPFSGSSAMVGDTEKKGVELAAKQINENGGINGMTIELIEEDDQQDPKTAVSAINKLVSSDEVVAAVGTVNSSCTLAMMDVTENNEIPLVTPISSGVAITDPSNSYIVRLQASDKLQAKAITEYAINDLGYKNIAVMFQNDDFGAGGKDVVVETLKDAGIEPLAVEAFDSSATDMSAQLLKIKDLNPEAIIMWTMYGCGATIAKQCDQLGIDCDLMGGGGLTNAKLYELGGESAVGILNTQTFFPDKEKASETAGAFIDAYETEYGETPDSNAAMSYDAMMVLAEGLKAATPDMKADDIMAGMKAVKDMPLATGTITIDENGDANRDILIIRLCEGGTYELVK
ncbi:ABC transporter substrate-binding protein [Oscillospiraceae bacterium Marseille-Q3528]|nr:ABC transporter substrate-binding protein [Oscillospiraceae bacterium Marseille-Q3528]WNV58816.1 ABC transporter substrate-binding protein [Oscillospiraceae bacterium NTUH-002-81]